MKAIRLLVSSRNQLRLLRSFRRGLTTLDRSPHVRNGPPGSIILTLLPTDPPNPHLALGSSNENPPEPDTFNENGYIYELIQSVISESATLDPIVQAQATAYASISRSSLAHGDGHFLYKPKQRRIKSLSLGGRHEVGQERAVSASVQESGGSGVCGWIHVADQRNPPDWGRIAWPEDILGSVQVDAKGKFVGPGGSYQRSGTYRIFTRDGLLHLSPYLHEKLIEKLKATEKSLI